jgi:predicted negative regulator of RcsB-dependent stress response
MPRPIKKKARKKEIGSEVEIQGVLTNLKDTLKKKQRTVLIYSLIGLSAIVVLAVILFSQYTADQKARQLETSAYNTYYNLYPKKNISKQEQYQQALELFQRSYSTQKSPRVLLYVASCYYELEKYDDALKTLNDFTKRHANAKDLLPIALQKIAAIQLIKGDKDAALKTLDALYKSGPLYQDYALIESGRLLEKEGKKAEATAKFKELAEKFPGSPFFDEAKTKLGDKKEG